MKHVVAIFDDGGSAAVAPGQLLVAVGDEVTFGNLTKTPVALVFPDDNLFKDTIVVPLKSGESSKALTVDKAELGGYPYTVYRGGPRQFAHASVPIIIIYRD